MSTIIHTPFVIQCCLRRSWKLVCTLYRALCYTVFSLVGSGSWFLCLRNNSELVSLISDLVVTFFFVHASLSFRFLTSSLQLFLTDFPLHASALWDIRLFLVFLCELALINVRSADIDWLTYVICIIMVLKHYITK